MGFFIEGFPYWRCNWSNWLCSGERLRILSEIFRGRGRNNDKYYYKRRRHHKVSGKIGISSFSFRFLFYYVQLHLLNVVGVCKTTLFQQLIQDRHNGSSVVEIKCLVNICPFVFSSPNSSIAVMILMYLALSSVVSLVQTPSSRPVSSIREKHLS